MSSDEKTRRGPDVEGNGGKGVLANLSSLPVLHRGIVMEGELYAKEYYPKECKCRHTIGYTKDDKGGLTMMAALHSLLVDLDGKVVRVIVEVLDEKGQSG